VNGASGGPALGGRAESSFGSGPASPVNDADPTPRAAALGVGNAVLRSVLVNGASGGPAVHEASDATAVRVAEQPAAGAAGSPYLSSRGAFAIRRLLNQKRRLRAAHYVRVLDGGRRQRGR
jgi:hypothetical protein